MMTVGSLFSGIGGIDLGLERAGMQVKWQVEIDPWCRAVLAKHWPDVERFEDVKQVGVNNLALVDVIAGGFPCQDISQAGRGAGIRVGTRSGLWYEFARIIRELRPRYVLVENVPMLLVRGLGIVLADLAACGYDAEWDCLPAASVGAPHRRDRLWLVAHANGRRYVHGQADQLATEAGVYALGESFAGRKDVADTHDGGWAGGAGEIGSRGRGQLANGGQWVVEPNVGRVAHGVPQRVDRIRGLGNAVVPQVVEWIGRRIVEAEAAMTDASLAPSGRSDHQPVPIRAANANPTVEEAP